MGAKHPTFPGGRNAVTLEERVLKRLEDEIPMSFAAFCLKIQTGMV